MTPDFIKKGEISMTATLIIQVVGIVVVVVTTLYPNEARQFLDFIWSKVRQMFQR